MYLSIDFCGIRYMNVCKELRCNGNEYFSKATSKECFKEDPLTSVIGEVNFDYC